MNKILSLSALAVAAAMTLASCGADKPLTSDSDYILIGPGYEGLIYRAKNETVNICENADRPEDKSAQREFLKIGMKLWWDALEIEDKPITWDKPGAECDLKIVIKRGSHARARPGKRPRLILDIPGARMGRQRVVNHELGHAFGLHDTYARSALTADGSIPYSEQPRCKPGQPEQSIMCNPEKYGVPQEDDILGVRHAYRNVHGDN